MDREAWNAEWHDRTVRYGATPLDHTHRIAITSSPDYLATFDGQVAALTAANLLGRISPVVGLSFNDIPLHHDLPWPGRSLHEAVLNEMRAGNPFGEFTARAFDATEDFRFHLGPSGADFVVHGSGWNAYVGPGNSPLPRQADNGLGAALAVVLAAGKYFRTRLQYDRESFLANALTWTSDVVHDAPDLPRGIALGNVLTVGLGSVGSAALYYLTLITRNFSAGLVDMDVVKIRNIARSPIFADTDKTEYKVDVVERFLRDAGVQDVIADHVPLHESRLWVERDAGAPDIVVSAANELDIRYHIESRYPPVQLYATTGKNWQVTALRHMPMGKSCSLCLFPSMEQPVPMACATDAQPQQQTETQVDAALPFLSFGAGLMTAAEIIKLSLPGYPFTPERVTLYFKQPSFVATSVPHRDGCLCGTRSRSLYEKMIAGSRYDHLS